jgi:GNAT superfamily N-acetyltransferase
VLSDQDIALESPAFARYHCPPPMSAGQGPSTLRVEVLPATAAKDQRLVGEVTDLVNRVYDAAEAGLWVDGATRTTMGEMQEMVAAEQIAVASLNGQVVGCIRVQELGDGAGEFCLLAADPAHRGEGVGRELVGFAEELCRRRGLAVMQLELLVPRGWSHPTKEFLHAWYTRIGYRPVRAASIEESYPQLAPLLATPCDFVVYRKPLTAACPGVEPH